MLSFTQTIYQSLACAKRLAAVAMFVGLMLCPDMVASQEMAVIRASNLNLRSRPHPQAPIRRQLQSGDQVTVLATEGDWLKISFAQTTGYILDKAEFVQRQVPPPAAPQPDQQASAVPSSLEEIRQKADALEHKIRQQKSATERIARSEADHVSALNKIDHTLNASRHRITALRMELSMLEDRIAKTRLAVESLEEAFRHNQTYMAKRLVALYKIRQLGTFHIMASASTMQEVVFRKSTLERILAHDDLVRQKLVRQRMELSNLMALLTHQKTEKQAKEKSMQAEVEDAARQKRKRQELLASVREKKALSLATLTSLKQQARELDETIRQFTQHSPSTPAMPGTKFANSKGRLPMPVEGKIVDRFGQYRNKKFNVINFRSGINIQADQGEPVRAIWSGRTLFANWFKGYGNMLIIDHGNSYYSVYAHAQELFKKKNDKVEKGEVIATVGETGSLDGPQLYFEIRHHGRPLDPLKWIHKG